MKSKLPLLIIVWFPSAIILLVFSLYYLVNFQQYRNDSGRVLSFAASDSDQDFDRSGQLPERDYRAVVLEKFFTRYKSPLINHIEEILKHSDLNGLDYALIPAIAMQESGGCKFAPENSYNCWGFGIYGDKSVSFQNFDEAISKIAKTLKESYIKDGLTNATLVEDRWTPRSIGQWSYSVNFFIGKIRELEKNI